MSSTQSNKIPFYLYDPLRKKQIQHIPQFCKSNTSNSDRTETSKTTTSTTQTIPYRYSRDMYKLPSQSK